MEDPRLQPRDPFPDPAEFPLSSPIHLLSHLLPNPSSAFQLHDKYDDGDHNDVLLHRHRRFVVTHSMVSESRFNLALLIIFILSVFVINAFFIVVILWSKRLRSNSKHLLILVVACGDLLQGLLILPLITDMGNRSQFDCTTFQVVRLFADFLIPSITTLGVLALNIDYILRLCCNLYSEGIGKAVILGSLIVTPWALSGILLVPIYVVGVQRVSLYNFMTGCHIVMEGGFARALLVLSYIFYGCLLLVLTMAVAMMYLIKRESIGLDVTGERVHAPLDICLASFVVILFYTPIFLFTLLTTEGWVGCSGEGECRTLNAAYTLSLWLMFAKSWVLPMAWFFGKDTRSGIKDLRTLC